ncbi:MAG TPA: cytochrome c3 family protein, partial [Bacillota bacterium]|nr:cytochrome c3 family protein [Bacillota bacterium]
DNYRLLRKTIYADDGGKLVTRDINYTAYAYTPDAVSGEKPLLIKGNSEFCSACHFDFAAGNAGTAGGAYAVSDPVLGTARYRHPVSVGEVVYSVYGNDGLRLPSLEPTEGDELPLQYNPAQVNTVNKATAVVCSTCHYAHGTTKTFAAGGSQYENRFMLRMDNYGVCESCHKK